MNDRFGAGTATLGEAIQKLRAVEAEGDLTNTFAMEVEQAFEQHDAIHILFNCGTSIHDEIDVHIWTIFATTAGISELHRVVANTEHRNVLAGIGHFKLLGKWFMSVPRILSIIFNSLRMKKRLAIKELSQLKQQSIVDIRREHGIVLSTPQNNPNRNLI